MTGVVIHILFSSFALMLLQEIGLMEFDRRVQTIVNQLPDKVSSRDFTLNQRMDFKNIKNNVA